MLRNTKLFLSFASVVALMAAVPTMSSAASFNYNNTGELSSEALEATVFTFNNQATVTCNSATGSGETIELPPAQKLYLTVTYSNCVGFGGYAVQVPPVNYAYNADGQLDLRNEVTLNHKVFGMVFCSVVLEPQDNLSSVAYTNNDPAIIEDSTVGGVTYTVTGPYRTACGGSGGTNGTLSAQNEIQLADGSGQIELWWGN